MTYAIIENNQSIAYPCYVGDISILHNVDIDSETWEGGVLDGIKYVKVKEVPLPQDEVPEWHYWDYDLPELISGEWVQKWVLKKYSDEFIEQQLEYTKKVDNLVKHMMEQGFDEREINLTISNIRPGHAQRYDFSQPTVQGLVDL